MSPCNQTDPDGVGHDEPIPYHLAAAEEPIPYRLPAPPGVCVMSLARVLDAERKRQDLSVYRLAKSAGMSAGRLHDILDGTTANPGILTVAAVLAGLGQSMAWLCAKPGVFARPKVPQG